VPLPSVHFNRHIVLTDNGSPAQEPALPLAEARSLRGGVYTDDEIFRHGARAPRAVPMREYGNFKSLVGEDLDAGAADFESGLAD